MPEMAKKTEMAKKKEQFTLAPIFSIKKNISENFEGITPQFLKVKIPAGGSLVFETEDEFLKTITGVIIDHYTVRFMFNTKFSGEKNVPVCMSYDGIKGQDVSGNIKLCSECIYNQWGSYKEYIDKTDTTNRKACHERHRIFIMRSGELLPILLTIPVTSIKNFAVYMTKLASKGKHYSHVITEISLVKNKSQSGIEYAMATFKKVEDIPEETIKEVENLISYLKPYCRQKPLEIEEEQEQEPF